MKDNIELEYKFAADGVDPARFQKSMEMMRPDGYVSPTVSDTFWENGASVLRHRRVFWGSDIHHHELTVKQRKSADSLKERIECNLRPKEDPNEIEEFLRTAGYTNQMCLVKAVCKVFKFHDIEANVEVALYTVDRSDPVGDLVIPTKTFIEVEVEDAKDQATALAALEDWASFMDDAFKVGRPINVSLYEMYRGKR